MKFAVVGSGGWAGSRHVEALRILGHEIVHVTRRVLERESRLGEWHNRRTQNRWGAPRDVTIQANTVPGVQGVLRRGVHRKRDPALREPRHVPGVVFMLMRHVHATHLIGRDNGVDFATRRREAGVDHDATCGVHVDTVADESATPPRESIGVHVAVFRAFDHAPS